MKSSKFFVLILILFQIAATPFEATVENLSGDRYAKKVLKEISAAEKSILLLMYQIEFNPDEREAMTTQLLHALKAAKDRGVSVRVLLDQHLNFKEDSTRDEWEEGGKNIRAYEYLKSQGIDVVFTDPDAYSHSKVVLIDEEVLILGSANWSRTSLSRNQESNVLIRSQDLAQEMLAELSEIKTQESGIQFQSQVYVPMAFLKRAELLRRMVANNNALELNLYLYLLREYNENSKGKIRLDFDKCANELNLDTVLGQGNYRRKLQLTVRDLKEKTRLLRYEETRDNYWDIFLLDYENERKAYRIPRSDSFPLPTTYWTYGWDNRLSMIAKALLYINYANIASGSGDQEWSSAIPTLERTYHYGPRMLRKGLEELRRWNLVELENLFFEGDSFEDGLNYRYRVKPLYDTEILKTELSALRARRTSDEVGFAQKTAEIIYKEKDVPTLERIIELREEYGSSALQKAIAEIRSENSDSPRRTLAYLESITKEKALALS